MNDNSPPCGFGSSGEAEMEFEGWYIISVSEPVQAEFGGRDFRDAEVARSVEEE